MKTHQKNIENNGAKRHKSRIEESQSVIIWNKRMNKAVCAFSFICTFAISV